jgi:hypothetical protein
MRMRKINYKLKIAIIGKEPTGNDLILKCLKKLGINRQEGVLESFVFQIMHKYIPIKIHVKQYETMNEVLSDLDSVNGFDFLFLVLNIYDEDSLNDYEKQLYEDLCNEISFRGSSLLIAFDMKSIKNETSINEVRISRHRLIRKCNELGLEFCFEIIDPNKDLHDLFKKVFEDSLTKFKISNPELYEKVKEFGLNSSEKVEKI